MPPKRENSKAAAARERKAAANDAKQAKAAADAEAAEAAEWSKGAKKNRKEDEERKRQEKLAKQREKAELEAAEARELASMKTVKAAPRAGQKKAAPAPSRNIPTSLDEASAADDAVADGPRDEFAARGLDSALDLMEALDVRGAADTKPVSELIERHPERRVKAAYAAFEEREMPRLRKEFPSLRRTQLQQELWKIWQKSPENPMNQAHVAFDASAEEAREIARKVREEKLEGYRVSPQGEGQDDRSLPSNE